MTASRTVVAIASPGGPQVLVPETRPIDQPGPGELLVRQTAIGVNYLDVYFRNGHFPAPAGFVPGFEGAGVVLAVGPEVQGWAPGDRLGYQLANGGYASHRTVPANRAVALPGSVDDDVAAASLLKGMTAIYLSQEIRPLGAGDVALVHAASGGVGSILTQLLATRGVRVLGTVGSAAKADRARDNGVDEVIEYRDVDFVTAVNAATNGRGVDVAFDGVGRTTFARTFACLAPEGTNVLYGWTSGPVGSVDVDALNSKSHQIAVPSLGTYTGTRERLARSAGSLFDAIETGAVTIDIGQRFPLESASAAHTELEARRTHGSTLLVP